MMWEITYEIIAVSGRHKLVTWSEVALESSIRNSCLRLKQTLYPVAPAHSSGITKNKSTPHQHGSPLSRLRNALFPFPLPHLALVS